MAGKKTGGSFGVLSSVDAEVDVANPWGDDALEREKFAKHLTNLVSNAGDAPFCVAVDGEWGSGKTFFLKRWREEFLKKGNKAIYFNAWEDDFYADPLTAIIGQLRKEIENPTLEEISNMCDSILKKTLIELLGKVLKGSGFEEKDLWTAVGGTVNEYLQARNTIEGLKQRLKTLAKDVRGEETKPPLVFIVDELDRCRPTFAIELLERVKHIVGVPGIVFVFGINQKELEKSIKSVYGEIEAEDYLRRFFQHSMPLPKAKASDYCRYLIKDLKISENIRKSPVHQKTYQGSGSYWHDTVNEIPAMVGYMGLSLRETEHVVRKWLFVLQSKEIAEQRVMYKFEEVLAMFILLRIKNRDMCERFFNEECEPQEVINYLLDFLLRKEIDSDRQRSDKKICIESIVLACYFFFTAKECEQIIMEFGQAINAKSVGELSQKCPYVPQKIIEIQNDAMRQDLLKELRNLIVDAANSKRDFNPPSREKIAHFLEWGDNWRF